MYDNIFEDFNVVKQHCERNGCSAFEESIVFELLEKYYPKYGSRQSIQKILDMLDAQRIREDIGNFILDDLPQHMSVTVKDENVYESSIDADDDESNESIIELEVPKKVFPFIDLTKSNSFGSDLNVEENIIDSEKHSKNSVNNSNNSDDENFSDIYGHDSSDPDIERHVNNDYVTQETKSHDPPLLDLLADLEDKSNTDIVDRAPSTIEISEIMEEENNNDPNNNLEGAIFEELMNVDRNNAHVQIADALGNSDSNNSGVEEIIDSMPGCSKDSDLDVIKRVYNVKNLPSDHSRKSPVAGCSRDFKETIITSDDSDVEDLTFDNDLILNDLICIQEIIPWAEIEVIIKLLKKNYNQKNRKELALWQLMQEQKKDQASKRKLDESPLSASSPPKKAKNRDCVDTVMIPSNESSKDLESSNQPESDVATANVSQNNQGQTTKDCQKNDGSANGTTTETANTQVIMLQPIKALTAFVSKDPISLTPSLTTSSIVKTNAEVVPAIPERRLSIPSSTLNSNKYFPNLHNEIEEFAKYFTMGKTETDSMLDSTRVIPNPVFKGSDALLHPLAGRSGAKAEKSSTIVRPSRLSPIKNPISAGPRPIPAHTTVFPAKLNFTDLATKMKNGENNHGPPQPTARLLTPSFVRILNKDPVGVLRTNPLWSKGDVSFLKAYQDHGNLIEEQKLIVRPPVLNKIGSPAYKALPHYNAVRLLNNVIKTAAARQVTVRAPATVQQVVAAPKPLYDPLAQPGPSSGISVPVLQIPGPSTLVASSKAEAKKNEVPHAVYVKLRSMFPEVKKSYIKHICVHPPVQFSANSDQQIILNVLIDHLLQEGSNNLEVDQMQPYEIDEPVSALTVDEKYEYLVGIFPNADPSYLRKFVEETTNDQAIEDFIQQKIESHDYPTKEDYLKKIKITEQIKQYTTNFDLKNFLEILPDPFKYFEDSTRQSNHNIVAMEFLKSHFNRYKVCTLTRAYRMHNYNLSLTAKTLSNMHPDMKSKRNAYEMPTENIPLLQEMAFIKNKQKIIDHIQTMKMKEEQLFKELKDKGLLLTCLCCYNDECMPTKSSECNTGHVFCFECIIRGTEAALADGNSHVRCFTDCQSDISLATLQKVLPPTQFSALLKKRQAAEVAAAEVDGLVSCPFCYFASIPPPEDKVFKCLNPECMKETCRLCKELNHIPLRCDEVIKTDKARLMIEEKMTEALLRTCYQCKKQFYKEEGCNKMRCPCGALMCYVCDRPVQGYNHFNAQGGANSNLCPLWSDDRRLNAEAVRKVAEEVKNSILKQNPNLKIDTEKLLPKVPPKSRGPHDDIPNANQLHEHVRRVANAP
ncbi:uncharacterized protein LOC106636490 [Copidosoma floridanum]|uniref:uncharacterized protein LOC106636490 n=1 Tax=Copidosoma floridanum TaxID=29053 RepID=UPI0006C9BCA2|nr:uncharacterized protein LOC106636490 [Copidosoma floridanum]